MVQYLEQYPEKYLKSVETVGLREVRLNDKKGWRIAVVLLKVLLFEFFKYFHINNEAAGCDGNTQVEVNQGFCSHLGFGAEFKVSILL